MKLEEALEILEKHNEWRRDKSVPPKTGQANPKELGIAIDLAIGEMKNRLSEGNKMAQIEESKTILQEAQDLVYGDRQADYGTVKENFSTIAKLWSAVLGVEVSPQQVGLCMVQVKVARQIYKPKRDNLVDGAGYFATIEKMENE